MRNLHNFGKFSFACTLQHPKEKYHAKLGQSIYLLMHWFLEEFLFSSGNCGNTVGFGNYNPIQVFSSMALFNFNFTGSLIAVQFIVSFSGISKRTTENERVQVILFSCMRVFRSMTLFCRNGLAHGSCFH